MIFHPPDADGRVTLAGFLAASLPIVDIPKTKRWSGIAALQTTFHKKPITQPTII